MLKINLGAGSRPLEGYVNVDIAEIPGCVDVVHDLDRRPWPFSTASVDEIIAFDIFEHVSDPLLFMQECGRVLLVGGLLEIHTTYWQHENAFTDPTHKRFCTRHTFDYWIAGTSFFERYGAAYGKGVSFREVSWNTDGEEMQIVLERL